MGWASTTRQQLLLQFAASVLLASTAISAQEDLGALRRRAAQGDAGAEVPLLTLPWLGQAGDFVGCENRQTPAYRASQQPDSFGAWAEPPDDRAVDPRLPQAMQ